MILFRYMLWNFFSPWCDRVLSSQKRYVCVSFCTGILLLFVYFNCMYSFLLIQFSCRRGFLFVRWIVFFSQLVLLALHLFRTRFCFGQLMPLSCFLLAKHDNCIKHKLFFNELCTSFSLFPSSFVRYSISLLYIQEIKINFVLFF